VLQKFRGELTMLGGRGDGGGASDRDEGGYGFGGGAPAKKSGPSESFSADLDDEIPF
jgi:single-strand DNA-binding protein